MQSRTDEHSVCEPTTRVLYRCKLRRLLKSLTLQRFNVFPSGQAIRPKTARKQLTNSGHDMVFQARR